MVTRCLGKCSQVFIFGILTYLDQADTAFLFFNLDQTAIRSAGFCVRNVVGSQVAIAAASCFKFKVVIVAVILIIIRDQEATETFWNYKSGWWLLLIENCQPQNVVSQKETSKNWLRTIEQEIVVNCLQIQRQISTIETWEDVVPHPWVVPVALLSITKYLRNPNRPNYDKNQIIVQKYRRVQEESQYSTK